MIFRVETPSHVFSRRRPTFTRSSKSCFRSQRNTEGDQSLCALHDIGVYHPVQEDRSYLCFGRLRLIGFILSMSKHVERTDRKAYHSSDMQHLWIPSTRPRFYQCEMEDYLNKSLPNPTRGNFLSQKEQCEIPLVCYHDPKSFW